MRLVRYQLRNGTGVFQAMMGLGADLYDLVHSAGECHPVAKNPPGGVRFFFKENPYSKRARTILDQAVEVSNGLIVKVVVDDAPGKIAYEDEYQVAVLPMIGGEWADDWFYRHGGGL
jgi:hypothetical protein